MSPKKYTNNFFLLLTFVVCSFVIWSYEVSGGRWPFLNRGTHEAIIDPEVGGICFVAVVVVAGAWWMPMSEKAGGRVGFDSMCICLKLTWIDITRIPRILISSFFRVLPVFSYHFNFPPLFRPFPLNVLHFILLLLNYFLQYIYIYIYIYILYKRYIIYI